MPSSTKFSEYEKGQIIAKRKCGMSVREIAWNINRHKMVIYYFLKNPKLPSKIKRTGRPPNFTNRQKPTVARSSFRKTEFYSKQKSFYHALSRTLLNVLEKNSNVGYA